MMRNIILLATAAVITLGITFSAHAAGDAAAGEAKSATCAACHGPKGISPNPIWPNLAGQKDAYLVKQIKAFRDGGRTDPSMAPMAAALSDEDIANLAAYYSAMKCE